MSKAKGFLLAADSSDDGSEPTLSLLRPKDLAI